MKREVCKFFSGSFAALAYVHAAYAVATSRGIINEPVFLGRRWGVGYMWTEAAVHLAGQSGTRVRRLEIQSTSAATGADNVCDRWAEQATCGRR